MKNSGYHHGDLRSALVEEGMRLLKARDAEALSLREIARAVGVSATSVYRHFPDKAALMTALATKGLSELGAKQREAAAGIESPEDGFVATGRAYVRFAIANPAIFRLIFTSPILASQRQAGNLPSEANTLLFENAAAVTTRTGGEAAVRAVQAWAVVHGLAMLMLDGQIPQDDAMIDIVIV